MDGLISPALEAHELYRFFHTGDDEILALRGVSFTVQSGEFVAVVGPSGSGKSTLLNCLAGLDEPDGGWVAVAGERISRRPEPERARTRAKRIGIAVQSGNLLNHLTLRHNIVVAMALSGSVQPSRVQALLEKFGLSPVADSIPAQLSGGEAARAGVALALANDPAVLLADEPTGEVDASNEERMLELLTVRASEGGAVVVVTHNRRVAEAAHRVLRLVDGRLDNS